MAARNRVDVFVWDTEFCSSFTVLIVLLNVFLVFYRVKYSYRVSLRDYVLHCGAKMYDKLK